MSGPFKLQTLLSLREQAQSEAELKLRAAVEHLEAVANEQRRLGAQLQNDEARLLQLMNGVAAGRTAAALQARDQFMARLRADVHAAKEALANHQQGPLAQALIAEQQARDELLVAKQDVELLHRHKDQAEAAERKIAERREDHAVDDWSLGRRR